MVLIWRHLPPNQKITALSVLCVSVVRTDYVRSDPLTFPNSNGDPSGIKNPQPPQYSELG